MNKEEFEKFMEEMLPLIEKMIDVAKKYNPDNELIGVACSADGYYDLSNHRSTVSAFRVDGKVHVYDKAVSINVPV